MKILFPIRAFYPHHGGGPSLSIYWLAKALVRAGNNVTVITTTHGLDDKYPADIWNNINGVNVQYCSSNLKLLRLTMKNMKSNEIIHLTSFCYWPSAVLACFSILFSNLKIVWSPRGELADSAINGSRMKRAVFNLYGYLFRHRIVFHGTSEKEMVEISGTIGDSKTILLPNYMELPNRLNLPVEQYLMYLGRISPIKSLDKLFSALRQSVQFMNSNYEFLVAGKSVKQEEVTCEKRLKEQVEELGLKDKVRFLGEVGGLAKDELLSGAYYSFLVSESENFGNVVVEAMAQGTPVVTSTGTPWHVLKEKRLGYCENNEPETLSKVIDELLKITPSDYSELREKVYSFCQQDYSIDSNIHKWCNFYQQLINSK